MVRRQRRPGTEPVKDGIREHWWASGVCRRCGMTQTETWVLDARGRPVIALVWALADGTVVRARPFAYFTGLEPPAGRLVRLEELHPGIEIGSVPTCPGQPRR